MSEKERLEQEGFSTSKAAILAKLLKDSKVQQDAANIAEGKAAERGRNVERLNQSLDKDSDGKKQR